MFKLYDDNFKTPVISSNYRKKKAPPIQFENLCVIWINTKEIFECYNSNSYNQLFSFFLVEKINYLLK